VKAVIRPTKYWCGKRLQYGVSLSGDDIFRVKRLTATGVEGMKSTPSTAILFITKLSFLVPITIDIMTALGVFLYS
jgi:hypothetical protein